MEDKTSLQSSQFQFGRVPDYATSTFDAPLIRNPVLTVFRLGLYAMYVGVLVDGLFPQIAIALLGGRDPYIQPILKLSLPCACVILWLIRGRLDLRYVGYPGTALMLYLLFDTLYFSLTSSTFSEAVFSVYVGYFTLVMILILTALDTGLSVEVVIRLLLAAFIMNFIIELAQYLVNAPILPLRSTDGNFAVTSFQFYGNIRAFGLFGSISAAGSFPSLVAALAIGNWRRRWSTLAVMALYAACILMVYVVRLRLGFIELALCTASALLLRFTPRARSMLLLPYIALAIMLLVLTVLGTEASHSTGMFDASSLFERIQEWQAAIADASSLSTTRLLLGTGMIQHRLTVGPDSTTWLDSMYLEVAVHIGFVGLAFLLAYYTWLYRYVLRWVQETGSPLAIAVAAVWSSLLALGVINLMYPNVGTYLIGLLMCIGAPATTALKHEAFPAQRHVQASAT